MNEKILQLNTSAFENGADIPVQFTTKSSGGENISIGVDWQMLPAAQSYAILFDDRHPVANHWVHWLVVDIPNFINEIPEGASQNHMPEFSRELMTSWGRTGYDGPQPPVGSGRHEYVLHLYALDIPKIDLTENVTRDEFLKTIQNHLITEETVSGFFERK